MKNIIPALTFDDVLLIPQYSEIIPKEVELKTYLTNNIKLNIPLISSPMDTVTEEKLAIPMALHGGIGVIHKNCSPEEQAMMVKKVKRFENGFILDPMVLSPQHKISDVIKIREEYGFKAIPITKDGSLKTRLMGLITRNDYLNKHQYQSIIERMSKIDDLLIAKEPMSLSAANDILEESKHSKLLLIRDDGTLSAILTRKDIEKNQDFPLASKDKKKRLLVAAAVGPSLDLERRVELLNNVDIDVFVVDTAHGHSKKVFETIKYIKKTFPNKDVIAGNIVTAQAAEDLIKIGVNAIKVGIGPGSICTTRIIAGSGMPQLSAILEVSTVCQKHNIPLIADGGIKFSGDIAKALAGGASSVMIGSLFAGTEEAPGEIIYSDGKTYKYYRGMGSLSAMIKGSKERYGQSTTDDNKLVPEGIEGKILYKGNLANEIFQLCGGVRSAMGYSGARNISEFQEKSKFCQITNAGLRESHTHNFSNLK